MSVSLPTCIAQLNSMRTAVCTLCFVKMIEKGMREGDCAKGVMGRGLWEKGCGKGTVGKEMCEGDCGKRDVGKGLWEMGCGKGTVAKGMLGRGL